MMHKVVAMPLETGDRAQPMEHTVDSRNLHIDKTIYFFRETG